MIGSGKGLTDSWSTLPPLKAMGVIVQVQMARLLLCVPRYESHISSVKRCV